MTRRCLLVSILLSVLGLVAKAQEPMMEYVEEPTAECQGDLRDIIRLHRRLHGGRPHSPGWRHWLAQRPGKG